MSNPSKTKGDQWERDVVAYLRDHGHPHAERAYGAGRADDVGDIDGLVTIIECKNAKRLDLAGWVDEMIRERDRSQTGSGVLIVKRRGRPAGDAYVIQPLEQWCQDIL
jgi:Holliday junction resolvase